MITLIINNDVVENIRSNPFNNQFSLKEFITGYNDNCVGCSWMLEGCKCVRCSDPVLCLVKFINAKSSTKMCRRGILI